jgi:hypothetical protein
MSAENWASAAFIGVGGQSPAADVEDNRKSELRKLLERAKEASRKSGPLLGRRLLPSG